jgi:hypothetical protein
MSDGEAQLSDICSQMQAFSPLEPVKSELVTDGVSLKGF